MIERLILVRHGETVDNLRNVAQGWSDSELSPRGQRQVEQVAGRLVGLGATSLYCSTLPRALTTAGVIAGRIGHEPVALDDLREINCGRWEGQTFAVLRETEGELHARWATDPAVRCPEGESFADVLGRVRNALSEIESRENGNRSVPVIVSHGTAIRIAATALLGLSLDAARNFAQDNAAINIFVRRGERWILTLWNDTTHCTAVSS